MPESYWTSDRRATNTVQTQNYGTFFKNLINKRGWHTYRDPLALVPYMLKTDGSDGFITYDDAFSTYYRRGIPIGSAGWVELLCGRWMRTTMGTRRICWTRCTRRR